MWKTQNLYTIVTKHYEIWTHEFFYYITFNRILFLFEMNWNINNSTIYPHSFLSLTLASSFAMTISVTPPSSFFWHPYRQSGMWGHVRQCMSVLCISKIKHSVSKRSTISTNKNYIYTGQITELDCLLPPTYSSHIFELPSSKLDRLWKALW